MSLRTLTVWLESYVFGHIQQLSHSFSLLALIMVDLAMPCAPRRISLHSRRAAVALDK